MKDETVAQAEDSKQIRYSVEIHEWNGWGHDSRQVFYHQVSVETAESIRTLVMQAVKK